MRSQAFTLIEVLVVVAIVAILAALLSPVFLSARSEALFTTERAKLRQIGMAAALYAPEETSSRVSDLRLLVDASLIPLDLIVQSCYRSRPGAWNLYESQHAQPELRPIRSERQSFLIKKVGVGIGEAFAAWLQESRGAGWLATSCHPLEPVDESVGLFSGPSDVSSRLFIARHLRLTYSGGVVTRTARETSTATGTSFGIFHYFTDEPGRAQAWLQQLAQPEGGSGAP